MMGLCVTVKTKVCNYGMVELMFSSFCWLGTTGPFGSCKSIFGKYFIFQKCYFLERKMYLGVWLPRKSFYGKSILMFGLWIILRKITISSTCIA